MINLPLQTVDAEQIQHVQDSLKQVTQAFVETIKEDPQTALQTLGQSALHFGLKVLAALAVYIVGAWVIKRIKVLMNRSFTRKGTDKTIASFANSCVSVTLSILLIILCISTLGINTTSLAALLAAGGMAVGMALSGTLQNFAGGIMLLIFKPFKAGDFIEAQGYSGTVTEVNICSTKLLTVQNQVIIIPNGALSSGNIVNYSQMPTRRMDIIFPMAIGTDTKAFMDAIRELIAEDSRVVDSFVGDSDVTMDKIEFVARLWTSSEVFWDVNFEFKEKAYTTLNSKGFKVAATRRLHLNNE